MTTILQIVLFMTFLASPNSDNCQGETVDGVQQGHWQCFYDNGKVREEGDYQQGKKSGHWKFYHENGNLALEGSYENGLEKGAWKMYDESGNQLDTIEY